MTRPTGSNDFDAEAYTKKVDDLEVFRKEFEGKAFDEKVIKSLQDSHPLREELGKIVWSTFRNKITWVIIGGISIVFIDLILRAIPSILSFFPSKP